MTISWSFSYNSLVKFHGRKKMRARPECDHVIPNLCYNELCYKGTSLYMYSVGLDLGRNTTLRSLPSTL